MRRFTANKCGSDGSSVPPLCERPRIYAVLRPNSLRGLTGNELSISAELLSITTDEEFNQGIRATETQAEGFACQRLKLNLQFLTTANQFIKKGD